jgi:hypothetical protein
MRIADMLTKIYSFQVESGDDFNPGIHAARDGAFAPDNQLFKRLSLEIKLRNILKNWIVLDFKKIFSVL